MNITKTRKFIWFVLLLAAVIIVLARFLPDGSEEAGAGGAGERVVITDMAGREVVKPDEINSIVVLSPADCEIIYALGAGSLLTARGEYCDYPSEALSLVSVQSGFETNIEQIVALNPDAVVMSVMSQSKEHADMLTDAGIAVFVTDAQDIAGVYTAIELMGQVTNKTAEAAALVSELVKAFAELSDNAAVSSGSVYFEVSPLQFGLWTTGQGTFMNEIGELLGLDNIFGEISGWAEVSQEQVIAKNPDYIVTTAMYTSGQSPVDEIKSRVGWEGVAAVMNDNVIMLNSDEISRPGPRILKAAQNLSEMLR